MLSNAAKRKILDMAIRNRISGKEVWVQDDYRQDCQVVMPDKFMIAVFDFKDALLDSKRFLPINYSILDLVMDFTANENQLLKYDHYYPRYNYTDHNLYKFFDSEGNPVYMQKKLLDRICYDPEDEDRALYLGNKGFVYYFDVNRGELDAVLPPFRIKEANDETD